MGDAGYRGVSADQDSRFGNKDRKLIRQLESSKLFPASFSKKVDLRKVNLEVMKPWVESKTQELLGFEDEVVVEYVMGMLESEENQPHPNPRQLQLSLTGFLESSTPKFMSELWDLLLSAQESIGGIPQRFVDKKKEEMRAARERDAAAIRASGIPGGAAANGRGPPAALPPRPSFAGQRGGGRDFRDKRGNATERVQDSGWGGSRHGPPAPAASRDPDRYAASSSYSRPRYDDRRPTYDQDRPSYGRGGRDDDYGYSRRRAPEYDEDRYDGRRIGRRDSPGRAPVSSSRRPRDYTRSPSRSLSPSRSPTPPSRRRRREEDEERYTSTHRRDDEPDSSRKRYRRDTRSITPPLRDRARERSRPSYSPASSRSRSRSRSPSRSPSRTPSRSPSPVRPHQAKSRAREDDKEDRYARRGGDDEAPRLRRRRSYSSSSRSPSRSRSRSPTPVRRRARDVEEEQERYRDAVQIPRRQTRSKTPIAGRDGRKRASQSYSSDASRSRSRSYSRSPSPPPPRRAQR